MSSLTLKSHFQVLKSQVPISRLTRKSQVTLQPLIVLDFASDFDFDFDFDFGLFGTLCLSYIRTPQGLLRRALELGEREKAADISI
jgi:hypothetical protein